MSNFRRRLMSKVGGDVPPTEGYIKDGLVFHLDGIDKGSDPLAWTDKVGGVKFTYHDCAINANNVEFDGVKSYAISPDLKQVFNVDNCTVEVCIENASKNAFILNTNVSNVCFYVKNDYSKAQVGFVNKGKDITYLSDYNELNKASVSLRLQNPSIVNKKDIDRYPNRFDRNYVEDANNSYLGTKYNSQYFKGKIHSIRIYNRQLTKEEMLHNQQVDEDRFFKSPYINFEDPEVERICIENFSSDGKGVTPEDAAKVKDLKLVFSMNKLIKTFDELKYFTSITFPEPWQGEFQQTQNLTKVTFPKNLLNIGNYTFLTDNKSVDLIANIDWNSIQTLHIETFYGSNLNLDSVSIPNLKELGRGAFGRCKIKHINNLGKITKLVGTTSSWKGTFQKCLLLEDANLPSTLISFGESEFRGCIAMKRINFNNASVHSMGEYCFAECNQLELLENFRLESIENLGKSVFSKCTKLFIGSSISMPNLKTIGGTCFYQTGIKEILDMGTITDLPMGDWVGPSDVGGPFSGCPELTKVIIPNTVSKIYFSAFTFCPKLKDVILLSVLPPVATKPIRLNQTNESILFYVPDASVDAYKAEPNWSALADKIKPLSSYVEPKQ